MDPAHFSTFNLPRTSRHSPCERREFEYLHQISLRVWVLVALDVNYACAPSIKSNGIKNIWNKR